MDRKDYGRIIGKSVVIYSLSDDREQLDLYFDDGTQASFGVDGDCCSQSWIESLDGEDALRGAIVNVEDIVMPSLGDIGTPNHPDVDSVAYYGLRITTTTGPCVVDYRNDSNGYYGGDVWLKYPASIEARDE